MRRNYLMFETTREADLEGERSLVTLTVELNDECGNGHCDFGVTFEARSMDSGKVWMRWRAENDEIRRIFPEYGMFIDLHMRTWDGMPLYPVANGMFHMKEWSREDVKEHMRITDDEYDRLRMATDDKEYFRYLLYGLGIVDRWKDEGLAAIKELERLTGDEWENPYGDNERKRMVPLTEEEREGIEKRVAEGYYTPEAIEDRRRARDREKMEKDLKYENDRYDEELRTAGINHAINVALIKVGAPTIAGIYYGHEKKVVINWSKDKRKATKEQYMRFMKEIDMEMLPEDVTFTFNE